MKSKKNLVNVAKRARRTFELIAKKEGFPDDLTGLCARSCAYLFEKLQKLGYPVEICYGYDKYTSHCWIEINRYIIDITASQFGGPKILVEKNSEYNPPLLHKVDSIRQLRLLQFLYEWPEDQIARYKEKIYAVV